MSGDDHNEQMQQIHDEAFQEANQPMSQELGEEDKSGEQGTLSKGSDPDSDSKNPTNENMNIVRFGDMTVNLNLSAFGKFNKQAINTALFENSSS
jgi:hypothetical protein